jgi:hypothetical protein
LHVFEVAVKMRFVFATPSQWFIKWEQIDITTFSQGYLIVKCIIRQKEFKPMHANTNKFSVMRVLEDCLCEFGEEYPNVAQFLLNYELYASIAVRVNEIF